MAGDTIINIPDDLTIRFIYETAIRQTEPLPAPLPGPINPGDIVRLKCVGGPKMVVGRVTGSEAEAWYISEVNLSIVQKVFPLVALVKVA